MGTQYIRAHEHVIHDNHPGGAEDAHGRTRTATHKAHDTCTARGRPLTKRNGARGRARGQRGRRAQGTHAPPSRSATAAWPSREWPWRRPRGRRRRVRSPLPLRLSDRGVVRAPEVVRARVDHAHVPADRRHAELPVELRGDDATRIEPPPPRARTIDQSSSCVHRMPADCWATLGGGQG